ncbi:hypothetical protein CHS0354_022366 [Potamilus streckersoni]|uniref:Peptidase S8/S53 domain-containing protein n=1 Tax=Potamilus streckersoni TaxID=2493646 RepID=A0AAE0T2E9_9BIVA|nr:hypothetical protein CHS0354_022366 [Potamilus streckersoni]
MKIVEAWQSGYNGSGIIVSVVDEGLQTDHSDLDANVRDMFDGHYDFVDSDSDPNPPFNLG